MFSSRLNLVRFVASRQQSTWRHNTTGSWCKRHPPNFIWCFRYITQLREKLYWIKSLIIVSGHNNLFLMLIFIRFSFCISRNPFGRHYLAAILSLYVQYIPRNLHTNFALLCFVVVLHWLIFPYPSNDCHSASKATLMNMDKYFMWIHYELLHNHNKAKHNKTVCIFLGIYCNGSSLTHLPLVQHICVSESGQHRFR